MHPDLVRRVRAAVEALSYQPNGVARAAPPGVTAAAAVIVPDVGDPFTSMVRGVEDVAQGSGYSVVLCNADENTGEERRASRQRPGADGRRDRRRRHPGHRCDPVV